MAIRKLGQNVRDARRRRQLTQTALAIRIGISRQRLGDIEAGQAWAVRSEVWFALAQALGIYLRFEFGRDPQQELRDAWHADIQELVLRTAKSGGWERGFEEKVGGWSADRSVDVRLINRATKRIVVNECWNTFGDLGEAARSSARKRRDVEQYAVAVAGDGNAFQVGLLWILKDTAANRAVVKRYPEIFESRFPGSSRGWLETLTKGGPMPQASGLVWCDRGATRLFARRR